jgi:hypothetical protein
MLCGLECCAAAGAGAAAEVIGCGIKSWAEMLIFVSSTGAWEQPKTVQPPFSATQAAWCGVLQAGQETTSSSASRGVRQ